MGKRPEIYDKGRCSGRKTRCNFVGMHILSVVAEKNNELKEELGLQMTNRKRKVPQKVV